MRICHAPILQLDTLECWSLRENTILYDFEKGPEVNTVLLAYLALH